MVKGVLNQELDSLVNEVVQSQARLGEALLKEWRERLSEELPQLVSVLGVEVRVVNGRSTLQLDDFLFEDGYSKMVLKEFEERAFIVTEGLFGDEELLADAVFRYIGRGSFDLRVKL